MALTYEHKHNVTYSIYQRVHVFIRLQKQKKQISMAHAYVHKQNVTYSIYQHTCAYACAKTEYTFLRYNSL